MDAELRPITRAGLKSARWKFTMHAKLQGGAVINRECVDFPGLVVSDHWTRKTDQTDRAFFVTGDDRQFYRAEDAARAWNRLHFPELAPAEARAA